MSYFCSEISVLWKIYVQEVPYCTWYLLHIIRISICNFAITRKNDAFFAKIANTCLTKIFVAIFVLAKRLPTFAILGSGMHGIYISRIILRRTQGQTRPFNIYMCGGATTPYGFEGIQCFAVTSAF